MGDLKTQVAVLVEKRLVRQVKQLEAKVSTENQNALRYKAELERAQQTSRVLQLRLDVLSANTRALYIRPPQVIPWFNLTLSMCIHICKIDVTASVHVFVFF